MTGAPDVVVVGGGVLGSSLGDELAGAGARTVLVDRADPGSATSAGAGILAPETAFDDDVRFALSMAAGAHYRTLVPALADAGAPDTGFASCGALVLGMQEHDDDLFERTAGLAARRCPGVLEAIDEQQARERFPPLGRVRRVLHNRAAARVDGRQLAGALLHRARARGLTVRHGSVTDVVVDGSRVVGVHVTDERGDRERIHCGAVVLAGGAWTPEIGAQLGVALPVFPVRGQILHARIDDESTGDWPLLQPVFDHYLVTWPGGRLVLGATFESEAGFDAGTTLAGVQQLIAGVARLAPSLRDARLGEIRVGLRPVSVDDSPILGPVPGVDGAFVATGHGANGLLLGPLSGRLVAQTVLGQQPDHDLTPFAAARF